MRKYPNKKKRTCYSCGSTEHFIMDWIAQMRKKRASMTRTRGITRRTKGNTPRRTMVEKLTLVMNVTPELKAQMMKRRIRLQPLSLRSPPLLQSHSTT
jgi:hypothetical protein